jgi:iron(III) transport system ATP-binding protein
MRRRLLEDTWRVLKESGAASVVVTHDPEEAMLLGDRVAVMRAGRVLQIGAADAVYSRPETPFVAEFLSEVNKFRGIVTAAGTVETPLGPIPAPGLAPGAHAIVIIRQHGVDVSFEAAAQPGETVSGSVPVIVEWVRPMGASSLVLLRRRPVSGGGAEAGETPIYARVSGKPKLAEGAAATAGVDPNEVFVFAAETPTSSGSGRG